HANAYFGPPPDYWYTSPLVFEDGMLTGLGTVFGVVQIKQYATLTPGLLEYDGEGGQILTPGTLSLAYKLQLDGTLVIYVSGSASKVAVSSTTTIGSTASLFVQLLNTPQDAYVILTSSNITGGFSVVYFSSWQWSLGASANQLAIARSIWP